MSKIIKLNSGYEMPIVGMGTYLTTNEQADQMVSEAIERGYRLIDTAFAYGNEKGLGQAVNKLISQGKIKREDVFITTKVWNTMHTYERAKQAINNALNELGLSYIDLLLIHYPMSVKPGIDLFPLDENGDVISGDGHFTEAWKALEEAVHEGKARSIGVSNFNRRQIEQLLTVAEIKPAINQIEMHPYLQQKKLRSYCQEQGIDVTAYSSLSNVGDTRFRNQEVPNLLKEPTMLEIGNKHNKSAAQIALRWAVQHGVAVIPKPGNYNQMQENMDIFDFELDVEDLAKIEKLDRGLRCFGTPMCSKHKEFPFRDEF